MEKGKRRFLVVGILFCLVLVLSASAVHAEKRVVRVWGFTDPGGSSSRGRALAQIIESFEKEYPNIRIEFETHPWQELSMKYMMAFAAGNEPDIAWVELHYTREIMKQGSAEDLSPWIRDWSEAEIDDFPEALWKVGVEGDKKYFLTTFHMAHTLGYRKSLFADAGISADGMRSWEEFAVNAQKLVRDKSGLGPIEPGFNPSGVDVWGVGMARTLRQHDLPMDRMMWSQGVPPLDPETFRPNWMTQEGLKSMEFCVDLIRKYGIESRQDLTYNNEDQASNFAAGLFAIGVVGSQKYQDIISKASWDPSDLELMRWPTFDGRAEGGPIDTWGWGLVMSSNSKVKDEAWRFLDHYVRPESDLIMAMVGGQLPTRQSTLQSEYFSKPEASYLKWYGEYMNDTSYMNQYEAPGLPMDYLISAFHKILLRNTPVEEAVAQAKKEYIADNLQ